MEGNEYFYYRRNKLCKKNYSILLIFFYIDRSQSVFRQPDQLTPVEQKGELFVRCDCIYRNVTKIRQMSVMRVQSLSSKSRRIPAFILTHRQCHAVFCQSCLNITKYRYFTVTNVFISEFSRNTRVSLTKCTFIHRCQFHLYENNDVSWRIPDGSEIMPFFNSDTYEVCTCEKCIKLQFLKESRILQKIIQQNP